MQIATYLETQGISDADFAARIGVDRSTVHRMRNRGQIPSAEVMREIARETGGEVTPNDFFGIAPAEVAA